MCKTTRLTSWRNRPDRHWRAQRLGVLMAAALAIPVAVGCRPSVGSSSPTVTSAATPTQPPMLKIVTPTPAPDRPAAPATPGGPPATAQPTSQTGTYVVQPGDTLDGIATKFNVATKALADANGITDPNSIQVGQVLKIPSGSTP